MSGHPSQRVRQRSRGSLHFNQFVTRPRQSYSQLTDLDSLHSLHSEVTFGLNPPVFDAVRMPRETAAQALLKAMREARDRRPEGSLEPTLGKLSLF